jgi:hypothetical protein
MEEWMRMADELERKPWTSAFWPLAVKQLGEFNSKFAVILCPFKLRKELP